MKLYYYDGSERKGPIASVQLRMLARKGEITPETIVENEFGSKIAAANIKIVAPNVSLEKEFAAFAETKTESKSSASSVAQNSVPRSTAPRKAQPSPRASKPFVSRLSERSDAEKPSSSAAEPSIALSSESIDLTSGVDLTPSSELLETPSVPSVNWQAPTPSPIVATPERPTAPLTTSTPAHKETTNSVPRNEPKEKTLDELNLELEQVLKEQVALQEAKTKEAANVKLPTEKAKRARAAQVESLRVARQTVALERDAARQSKASNAVKGNDANIPTPNAQIGLNPAKKNQNGGCSILWIVIMTLFWLIYLLL